jgi:archaetidylinositol phosphate synthase
MVTEVNAIHVREHGSLLAAAEKRALVWMAERLPGWVSSDHLTLLGFLAMGMAGASYWAASRNPHALVLAVFALALNWFGDSLDGTLARVRNRQRPRYGYYVDHVVDLAGPCFILGGLALSGYMSPPIAVLLLIAFLLVMAEAFLATHVNGVFRLAFGRMGPTELRIVLAVGTLYLLYEPLVMVGRFGPYRLFDVGGVLAAAGLFSILVVSAFRNARALYRAEALP